MEETKTITIACQGATTIELDEMTELQGSLKDLNEDGYIKLRDSILKYGFSFPVIFWQDPADGVKWIIDAHQRKRALTQMRDEEGYTIPPLPAVPIQATSRVQAKEKLLMLNSRYGKITREGFDEFIDEVGFEVNESDLEGFFDIPEVQMWNAGQVQDLADKNKEIDREEIAKDLNMKCPKCGFDFKGKEGLTTNDQS